MYKIFFFKKKLFFIKWLNCFFAAFLMMAYHRDIFKDVRFALYKSGIIKYFNKNTKYLS